MNKQEIYEVLTEKLAIPDVKVDEPMKNHTTFKIGGNADIFVKIDDVSKLQDLLLFVKNNNLNMIVIGNGSNILVKDNGIRGIVVKINIDNLKIEKNNKEAYVTVGAGVSLGFLAQKFLKEKISGFEFASGIPGTIGGAIRMNAGAYGGEFKDIVFSTKCMDEDGNIFELDNKSQKFSYRHSIFMEKKYIVIETKLKLMVEDNFFEIKKRMEENLVSRKLNQPINFPNAGSTFKRGENFIAAKIIDECGLRGFSIGDAVVSEKHAGFIVNKGNATAKDVLDLVKYVKKQVKLKFDKELRLEIEVIGE